MVGMKRSAASPGSMEPASRRQQLVHGRTDATPDAAEAVLDACEADEAEEAEETGSSDLFGSDSDDSDGRRSASRGGVDVAV